MQQHKRILSVLCVLMATALLLPLLTAPASAAETDRSGYPAELARLINAEREKQEIAPLDDTDQALHKAAQTRAAEAAQSFSHLRPGGRPGYTAIDEQGVLYASVGESLAAGHSTPQSVAAAFLADENDRRNLLNQKYTHIGVGIYEGEYTLDGIQQNGLVWVVEFIETSDTQHPGGNPSRFWTGVRNFFVNIWNGFVWVWNFIVSFGRVR